MRSWSAVAVLLVLTVPVHALSLDPQGPDGLPEGAREVLLPSPLEAAYPHPFQTTTPEAWAARVASGGHAEAMRVAPEVRLTALGDADRDGRDDVLRITDDEDRSFEARAGPDLEEVLWALDAPRRGHGYVFGDLDGDHVLDIAMSEIVHEEETQTRYTVTERVTILSGRDAQPLMERELTSTYSWRDEQGGIPFVAPTYEHEAHFEIAFLTDLDIERPGADVLRYVFEEKMSDDRSVVEGSTRYHFSQGVGIERLDTDGVPLWSVAPGEGEYAFLAFSEDLDLDGTADPALLVFDAFTFEASYGLFGGTFAFAEAQDPRVRVLDGATGEARYERAIDGVFNLLGDLYGDGIVAVEGEFGGPLTVFDAWTGEDVGRLDTDGFAFPIDLGDIDRDGDDDLLLVRGRDPEHLDRVEAVDEDLEVDWEAEMEVGTFPWAVDVDGDDTKDVLVTPRFVDGIRALDGRDGDELWTMRHEDPTVHGFQFVKDIDLDGGLDVVQLVYPNATERTEDLTDMQAYARVLAGSDLDIVFETLVHDPAWYAEKQEHFGVFAQNGGDLDGNGADDLLVHMVSSGDEEHGSSIRAALALESATGRTLARMDQAQLADGLEPASLLDVKAEVGPAGEDLQAAIAPGILGPIALGIVVALGVVATIVLVRRRKD